MAQITINIPDAVAARVIDAVATRHGWSADSGLTKAQFAKRVIIGILKDTVKSHEANTAAEAAGQAARSAVDNEIDIT